MLRFLKRASADVPTPAANKVTMFIDTTGTAKLKNESGTVSDVGGSGTTTGVLKDFAYATKTNGNLTFTTTSWADVSTAIDLVLTAAVGDIIEVGAMGMWDPSGSQSHLGVFSVVGGSPVNSMWPGASAGTASVIGWMGLPLSAFICFGGSFLYPCVSGDLSGGTITIRLRGKLQAAGSRILYANTIDCLHWWAKNIGPQL
jgi:hypothetical protein